MKTIDFQDNINCIRETSLGQYRIILNFATTDILPFLLKDDYNYVWVHNHTTGTGHEWQEFNLPIKKNSENIKTLARSVTFDFILTTTRVQNDLEIINMPPNFTEIGDKKEDILESNPF